MEFTVVIPRPLFLHPLTGQAAKEHRRKVDDSAGL